MTQYYPIVTQYHRVPAITGPYCTSSTKYQPVPPYTDPVLPHTDPLSPNTNKHRPKKPSTSNYQPKSYVGQIFLQVYLWLLQGHCNPQTVNCVTQLKLDTGENLSSPIFCCLSVRHRCHPTKYPLFPIYTGIQALC